MRLLSVFVSFVLLCTACAQPLTAHSPVRLFDSQGKLHMTISDAHSQAALQAAWQNKHIIIFKKRPDFQYRIELPEASGHSSWWYTGSGFTTRADKEDGVFYKLDDVLEINRLLQLKP